MIMLLLLLLPDPRIVGAAVAIDPNIINDCLTSL